LDGYLFQIAGSLDGDRVFLRTWIGRDEQNGDASPCRISLKSLHGLLPVHDGHAQVEQNDARRAMASNMLKSGTSVHRDACGVTCAGEQFADAVRSVFVILDDEDRRSMLTCCPAPASAQNDPLYFRCLHRKLLSAVGQSATSSIYSAIEIGVTASVVGPCYAGI
jgi:hypothetical protein